MALPDYHVEEVQNHEGNGSYTMYVVACPRCTEEFWVPVRWAVMKIMDGPEGPVHIHGRMCPWCSKTSAIPADRRIKNDPPMVKPPARRVVKLKKGK